MKISVLAFSLTGEALADRLADHLSKLPETEEIKTFVKSIHSPNSISESLSQWTEKHFHDSDALIYVSSCGIAVRAIAPFVKSKKTDPAVIVIDELGRNVISLLSGHIGGANELTAEIAKITGGNAVITTATDIHGKGAPDVFAKKNGLIIDDFTKAKEYAALMIQDREDEMDMWISPFRPDEEEAGAEGAGRGAADAASNSPEADCLWLIPKWAYVGLGCRRNTEASVIDDVYNEALKACNMGQLDPRAIRSFASVTLKADEKGLLEFCEQQGVPVHFFTLEELEKAPGEYTESEFVRETVGVGSVCERSAMLASLMETPASAGQEPKKSSPAVHEPYFTLRKFARDGVTIAIVIKEEELKYE